STVSRDCLPSPTLFRSSDRDFGKTRLLYGNNMENTGGDDGLPDKLIYYNFGEFYYHDFPTFALDGVNYGYQNGSLREFHVVTPRSEEHTSELQSRENLV